MDNEASLQPTININEAGKRAQEYLDRAANEIFPAGVERIPSDLTRNPCDDPTDNGPEGREEVSREYQLINANQEEFGRYFNSLRQWWQHNNYALKLNKADEYGTLLGAENRVDGFSMSLQSNDTGGLYLTSVSLCVWPKGTPEPETSAGR